MEILPSLLSWIDSSVQTVKRNISDLVSDTGNALEKTVANTRDTLYQTLGIDPETGKKVGDVDVGQFLGAGTFIGKGAKLWNPAKAIDAMEMKLQGADPREIWKKTGTWTESPDNVLLQEISDLKSHLNPYVMETNIADGSMVSKLSRPKIKDNFTHPDLYSAYPELGDIWTVLGYGPDMKRGGMFSTENNFITVSGQSPHDVSSIILHELQHAVQRKEGMGAGGTPKDIPTHPETKDLFRQSVDNLLQRGYGSKAEELAAFDLYSRLYGEGMARATQARANLSVAERLATYPEDSFDRAMEEFIVRK